MRGESMPNDRIMKRMSDYFGVRESELVREASETENTKEILKPDIIANDFSARLRPLIEGPAASLKAGYYYTWMTVPGVHERLICAPLFVNTKDNVLTFRRIVGLAEPRSDFWSHFRGDHQGIVTERLNWFFFAGVNQTGTKDPTLMRVQWVPMSEPVLAGHAMVLSPNGVSFVAVCMRPMPDHFRLRQALRFARTYDIASPEVDYVTKTVLDTQRRQLLVTVTNDLS
jgi:hypothetical protein